MKYAFEPERDITPEEATSYLSDFRKLIESRAWQVIDSLLRDHYTNGMAALVATPLKSADDALAQEYEKGKLAEACVLRDLPAQLITYFEHLAVVPNPDEEETF